ncbi:MAG: hypothetical protein JO023_24125 [Chloroflexi bacterium]|nr:hypothetical protein [Chloroflexota bacterium]
MRRLEAIEDLGNMDTLCSGKTGRLTTIGKLTVEGEVDFAGHNAPDALRWARHQ